MRVGKPRATAPATKALPEPPTAPRQHRALAPTLTTPCKHAAVQPQAQATAAKAAVAKAAAQAAHVLPMATAAAAAVADGEPRGARGPEDELVDVPAAARLLEVVRGRLDVARGAAELDERGVDGGVAAAHGEVVGEQREPRLELGGVGVLEEEREERLEGHVRGLVPPRHHLPHQVEAAAGAVHVARVGVHLK